MREIIFFLAYFRINFFLHENIQINVKISYLVCKWSVLPKCKHLLGIKPSDVLTVWKTAIQNTSVSPAISWLILTIGSYQKKKKYSTLWCFIQWLCVGDRYRRSGPFKVYFWCFSEVIVEMFNCFICYHWFCIFD